MLEAEGTDDAIIKGISDKLGLDYQTLKKDMDETKLNESIERNLRLATAIGVNGTPAYLVGDQFIPGAIDGVALTKVVAEERARLAEAKNIKVKAETK